MTKPTDILWCSLSPAIEDRLYRVLDSWRGTGYMAGQQAKGIYVDCAQLVGGALDEAFRRATRTSIPRLPPNSGMHYRRAGLATARAIRRGFPSIVARDKRIEPGDVIVTRGVLDESTAENMGHTTIAGIAPWTFLHAVPDMGVCWTSIEALPGILRCYRPLHKEQWA